MSKRKLAGIIVACIIVIIVVVVMLTRQPSPTSTYTLSVSVNPSGAGSISPSGGEYESGVQVTLTASPASGYTFDYWGGDAAGTSSQVSISMDRAKSVTAHFKQFSEVVLYRDENGYFAALPPEGWEQKDYPEETIRSKVEFYHPTEEGINIRIIVGPTPTADYTIDDLYTENEQKLDSYFRAQYPDGVFTITRRELGEFQAISQGNSIPRMLEQEIVMVINSGLYYSISFGTTTRTQFDNYYLTFQGFLEGFVILEPGESFSDEEMIASLVAKYKRLAELHEEIGRIEEALEFVRMGLALDPDNIDLKTIESRLQS